MYCGQCGTSNDDSDRYCIKCGKELAPQASGSHGGAPGPGAAAVPVADGALVFAGFWTRVAAYIVDYVILVVAIVILAMATRAAARSDAATASITLLLYLAVPWLYTALFESGPSQATPGKLALQVKVTDLQGRRIGFGRATARYFAEWITGLTFGVGYAMTAFTSKRQALHDKIAETVVVKRGLEPEIVASASPAKPVHGLVIALAILLTSVPMIGILAAIAIPAYQDYTIRSQVTEGLMLAQHVKAGVADYASTNGEWPVDAAELGLEADIADKIAASHYLDSMDVSNGTITITYGRNANQHIQDMSLSLRPYLDEAGEIAWQCGNLEIPGIDESGSDPGLTSVADKHLPSACRAGSTRR